MNIKISNAPLLAITGLTLVFGPAFAGEINVNCDEGDSLQKAIDSGAGSAARREIFVTGFCEEDLLISKDRISFLGDGNTVISGQIVVRGSDGLAFRDLSITGPGDGISASVSRIFMVNVHFTGNHGYGIALRHGGAILLRNGSIAHNNGGIGLLIENGHGDLTNTDVFGNANDGIVINVNGNLTMIGGSVNLHEQGTGIRANLSSSVELEGVSVSNNEVGMSLSMGAAAAINNSTINDNLQSGIDASGSSTLIVSGGSVSGNGGAGVSVGKGSSLSANGVDIGQNGLTGVGVSQNSIAQIEGCTIGHNARINPRRSGVFVSTSSSATIDSTAIFGNWTGVGVARQSFVNVRGTTEVRDNSNDGLRLAYDSGAIVDDPVYIPENGSGWAVTCRDTESSFENRSAGVGPVDCKGFDLP